MFNIIAISLIVFVVSMFNVFIVYINTIDPEQNTDWTRLPVFVFTPYLVVWDVIVYLLYRHFYNLITTPINLVVALFILILILVLSYKLYVYSVVKIYWTVLILKIRLK